MRLAYLLLLVPSLLLNSCGNKMVKTYSNDDWNNEFRPITSDSTGQCNVYFKNKNNIINVELTYISSYQTANELIHIDFDIVANGLKLEAASEKFCADDGDYKLIVGYQNKVNLDKNEEWKKIGTMLHIDTVKNEYLSFRLKINKKMKVKKEFPKEIKLLLFTETTLGKKDTAIILKYDEYKDTRAPFRFH